ncbi:MAG TPA: hypothetical protein VLA19_11050 [Herpetosiphonaceae bacterium]|nr:hypothetical protein [Herpetosiphonaceae bacterium]
MIRPATFADLWGLRRKPARRIFFYSDALLASSFHPFLLALRSMLDPMGASTDQRTLVLRDHGLRGYLQACRRSNKREVDLQFLTAFKRAGREGQSDGELFYRLIEDLLKRAGSHKIERVFATVGSRADDVVEVLRQLGFQPYTQQAVWMLPEPALEVGSTIVALRRQQRRDAWAIHQLYSSVSPRHVQQAELRDSTSWETSGTRRLLRGPERAWVLGDDQALTVQLQLRTGTRGHVLQMLVAPHLRTEAAAMVRYVLSQLHDERPVFAVVRSYQSELGQALEELGFVMRGEQTLYAKQLAILQRESVFLPALRRSERAEGAIPTSTIAAISIDGKAE